MGSKSRSCCQSPFGRQCGIFSLVQYLVALARSAFLALQIVLPCIYLFVPLCFLDRDDFVLGGLGSGDDGLGNF